MSDWIKKLPRSDSFYSYPVSAMIPVDTNAEPPLALLAELLKHSYFDPEYLQGLATRYAWQKVHEKLITPAAPTLTAVRRGDFGEAIAAKALEELEDYHIPINKLRYKVGKNQTLPGTDCLALKIADSGELDEVCFVESKLRTARDDSVAVKGYQQLVSDVTEAEPVILSFVARQLTAKEHPLARAFHNYFFSRDRQIETYKLWICHDTSLWREKVLQDLEDYGVHLQRFEVYIHLVVRLAPLIEEVFHVLGAIEVVDDDD